MRAPFYFSSVPSRRNDYVQAKQFDAKNTIMQIRGGESLKTTATPSQRAKSSKKRRASTATAQKGTQDKSEETLIMADGDARHGLRILSVLIPRQTSYLKPLRFLFALLLTASFTSCVQTAGQPLNEAVRRILGMPHDGSFISAVTPLHIYAARKMAPGKLLPPGHLPSPLPLLHLFGSLLLYAGGLLLPRWSVYVNVLLNYERYDYDERNENGSVGRALQAWFGKANEDDRDPFYASSQEPLVPAVLLVEGDARDRPGRVGRGTPTVAVHPLHVSPESPQCQRHPRRYYFEREQQRFYFEPVPSTTVGAAVAGGGPRLHETSLAWLLSDASARGLDTSSRLAYARERYSDYVDIRYPVPTLRSALVRRITSPLVSLQLVGRLLTWVEEESILMSIFDLLKLGSRHILDAKKSITAAVTLAEEVKEIDKPDGAVDLFWALRPALNECLANATTVQRDKSGGFCTEWVKVYSKEILPGDVFLVGPTSKGKQNMPVDALLLEGMCVVEEAAMTGESVPQVKVPLENAQEDTTTNLSSHLDMDGRHRSSCVFAGTVLLSHGTNRNGDSGASSDFLSRRPPLPSDVFPRDNKATSPAVFLALRTGSYSSRGEIVRSLLRSRTTAGFSNRDHELGSTRLIGAMALFAAGACASLLLDTSASSRKASGFKRIVQASSHRVELEMHSVVAFSHLQYLISVHENSDCLRPL